VPSPRVKPFHVKIEAELSVISPGTEKSLIAFARAGLLQKARLQPEKVNQVRRKIQTDGISETLKSVRARADEPIVLGYSSVGRVVGIGAGVSGFSLGDRVVSNASHSEIAVVPANFVVKVPKQITSQDAVFGVLGSVSLQGIRLLEPSLGETIVVIGLGVIGILACQILRAHGCDVIATDISQERVNLARSLNIPSFVSAGHDFTKAEVSQRNNGLGVDGVVIATSTDDSEVLSLAASVCRKKGRLVLIGTAGPKFQRSDFYDKELSFQVSSSYGPGRYDPDYEKKGQDYPRAYVRWSAGRNIQAVLSLIAKKQLELAPLVSSVVPFYQASEAYEALIRDPSALTVVLDYGTSSDSSVPTRAFSDTVEGSQVGHKNQSTSQLVVSVLGAGNFTRVTLAPILGRNRANLGTVVSESGLNAALVMKRHNFARGSSNPADAFENGPGSALFIATRHDSHARYAVRALEQGISTYVEKPLGLSHGEIDLVEDAWNASRTSARPPVFTLGFNRRFAPLAREMKSLSRPISQPKVISIKVNAGTVPANHWLADPQVGGGRTVGEVCHFVDLFRYLVGAPIVSWHRATVSKGSSDSLAVTFEFQDGSLGILEYSADGSRLMPKERIELSVDGATLVLDNFRELRGYGWPGFRKKRNFSQDKGHSAAVGAFLRAAEGSGGEVVPFDEILEVSRVVLDIAAGSRSSVGTRT